jgi:hypothetical protein
VSMMIMNSERCYPTTTNPFRIADHSSFGIRAVVTLPLS